MAVFECLLSHHREQIAKNCLSVSPTLTTESSPLSNQLNTSHLTVTLQNSNLMAVLAKEAQCVCMKTSVRQVLGV